MSACSHVIFRLPGLIDGHRYLILVFQLKYKGYPFFVFLSAFCHGAPKSLIGWLAEAQFIALYENSRFLFLFESFVKLSEGIDLTKLGKIRQIVSILTPQRLVRPRCGSRQQASSA